MIQHNKGRVAKQAHVGVPEGLYEDELGRQGFSGRVALFYRRHPPIEITRIEGRLATRAMRGYELTPPDQNDPKGTPIKILYNDDLRYFVSRRSMPMPFYFRNADGDEIHFVHRGHGIIESEFGALPYEEGDFIVIPKGVTYRIVPETKDNYSVIVEARGEVILPDRGLIGQFAPFDTGVFVYPELCEFRDDGRAEYEVRIKREDEFSSAFYAFCPLDVEGWKGTLCVFKFNARDFRSLNDDRVHLPPSAHAIFQAPGFIYGLFAPRRLELDKDAVRVPWYHRNIDYDEIYFVHRQKRGFDGREGAPGILLLFPQGIHHGLPREAYDADRANELPGDGLDFYIVGVDAERPVKLTREAEAVSMTTSSA
ncbi:MAG TPA: homogentisate 1,2-dioxygenase [Candidatus Binataceae bacterium]